ncbi:MAG TPA: ABC transporter ATP-binding protein [Fimbriimonadaceae bacterium]|nr:ABC transporter ATP-binding protein [Fimbriimonadaceae bacterium]
MKDLDLRVERGEIYGFLGPNGAGKTTTIKILLGIIHATHGEAKVLDKYAGDIEAHKKLAYLPERPYYYEHMTGLEIMHFYASLFRIRDDKLCKDLLERVNLQNDMNRPIGEYSKGMQQRVGLAQSLLNDPELLFLDEPTGGLDPLAHKEVRDLILQFRDEGRTVFISSHELSEVERICNRVAIINKGRVIKQGNLVELLTGARVEMVFRGLSPDKAKEFASGDAVISSSGDTVTVDMADTGETNGIVDAVRSAGASVVSIVPRRMRLEDLFVESVREVNSPATAEVTA